MKYKVTVTVTDTDTGETTQVFPTDYESDPLVKWSDQHDLLILLRVVRTLIGTPEGISIIERAALVGRRHAQYFEGQRGPTNE